MKRREFVRTAGGATAVAAAGAGATGTVAAQELQPVWPSAVTGANLGTYQDARGESEVTVQVGAGDSGLAFDATKLWVDPGTTITFEWTGNGGAHNVQNVEGPASLDSGDPVGEEGATYEYETSEEDVGITHYHCVPHTAVGMHAGLAVGEDIETESAGGGGEHRVAGEHRPRGRPASRPLGRHRRDARYLADLRVYLLSAEVR